MKAVLALVLALSACTPTLEEMREASDATSKILKECRAEAREALYVDKKSADESMRVYEKCKKRGGL